MDILIVGVGGQGTLLASRILGAYAYAVNQDVKLNEVHGMSQRGGSVVTHVRVGVNIASPTVSAGDADIVLAFEQLEAMRYAHFLKKGGSLVVNTQKIMPMGVITGQCQYPTNTEERLNGEYNKYFIDAESLAEQAGNVKAVNVVMIGALTRILKLDEKVMKSAIENTVPAKFLELNIQAFESGYNYGVQI